MIEDAEFGSGPSLRFPKFRDKSGWVDAPLRSLMEEHGLKSDGSSEVCSVSLTKGVVSQIDHLGRSYAAASTTNYNLVRPFDLVYTRSPLARYPLGIVKQYRGERNVLVSPLYGVFTPRNRYVGRIIEAYFDSPNRSFRYLDPLAQKGAKNTIQLSNDRFLAGGIAVPVDENEQLTVAGFIDSIDELISEAGRKLEALTHHRQGLLAELFPQAGESLPYRRFPEFQTSPSWRTALLGDLFETASGGTPDRACKAYWCGPIPWVTTSLVNFNVITETIEQISPAALANSSAKVFPTETVLVAMYGQGKTRGQVAILGTAAATNQACMAILPNDRIDPLFVFYNLRRRYEEMRAMSNSGGQQNLSQKLLHGLPFSYPETLIEQRHIAECLKSLDTQVVEQSSKLEALRCHRDGLLQGLFPTVDDFGR